MGKVEWTISVPEEPAREIEETASEVGLTRDDFVSEVLRVGLDHRSREAGETLTEIIARRPCSTAQ